MKDLEALLESAKNWDISKYQVFIGVSMVFHVKQGALIMI